MAHENLINARMTWLVVSESFIFSADAVILASNRETSAGKSLLWILPILGILLIALVWPGLSAAKKVMHALCKDRANVDEILRGVTGLDLTNLGPVRERTLHNTGRVGDMPVDLVPLLLAIGWIVILILQIAS